MFIIPGIETYTKKLSHVKGGILIADELNKNSIVKCNALHRNSSIETSVQIYSLRTNSNICVALFDFTFIAHKQKRQPYIS